MIKLSHKFGFTLIELLVVISIMAILTLIAIPFYQSFTAKGRDAKRLSDLKVIQGFLQSYYSDQRDYPTSSEFVVGGPLAFGGITYTTKLPSDPSAPGNPDYRYIAQPTGCDNTSSISECKGYCLYSKLEDNNKADITSSCPDQSGYNFEVTSLTHLAGLLVTPTPITTGAPTPTNGPSTPLATNLLYYWKLDDATANNSPDAVSNMVLNQGSTSVNNTGKISKSRDFISTSLMTCDDFTCGGVGKLDIGIGGFTIAAWVKTTGSTDQVIAGKGNTNDYSYSLRLNTSGGVSMTLYQQAGSVYLNANSANAINDGNWHYIVGTATQTTALIYVDGILKGTSATPVGSFYSNSSQPFYVGARSDGFHFVGSVDEIGIWKRAISEPEVSQLYNCNLGNQYPFITTTPSSLCLGLASYWKLDESPQTTPLDDSVVGNDGTVNGPSTNAVMGRISNGHAFNGSSDYIGIANSSSLNILGPVTISTWVKPTTASGYQIIFSRGGGGISNTQFELRLQGSIAELVITNGTVTVTGSGGTITANTWNHVVGWFDGTTVKVYVNNQLGSTIQTFSGTQSTSTITNIGARANSPGSYGFTGTIDEVGLWGRALVPSEIAQLYGCSYGYQYPFTITSSLLCTSLASYWKMDETTGSNVADSQGLNSGTATNASIAAGRINNGRSYAGSGNYITVGSSSSLRPTLAISVAAWIKTSSASNQMIYSNWWGSGWRGVNLAVNYGCSSSTGGKVVFTVGNDTPTCISANGTTIISDGNWHYLVGVFNPGVDIKLYVDGVLDGSSPTSISTVAYGGNTCANTVWGAECQSGASYGINGLLDEVAVWNKALTAPEVTQLYNCGNGMQIDAILNLICNGGFEANTSDWGSGGNSAILRDTTEHYLGDASVKVTATAAGNAGLQKATMAPVTPAVPYQFSAYVKSSDDIGRAAYFWVYWFNSSGGDVGENNYGFTLTGSWSLQSLSVTPPAGATQARLHTLWTSSAVGKSMYVDNVRFQPL